MPEILVAVALLAPILAGLLKIFRRFHPSRGVVQAAGEHLVIAGLIAVPLVFILSDWAALEFPWNTTVMK